jgi:group II intron reverse transcriptase/maturase
MEGTSGLQTVSTKQARIAELARRMPDKQLSTLSHYIDIEWLTEAYRRTRKSGAPGVDGQTAADYAQQLPENLETLLNRAKSGDQYRAPPVRRVHIPKGDGKSTRPIGIPTFEDKVLQRAVVMVLEPIYETMFRNCSYGFRPGRSAHHALERLRDGMARMGGGWTLELDIKSYFDTVDHEKLRELLRKRVSDGVLLRLIGKWLRAGVLEEGCVYHPESGTPQGGVLSPLLANLYLHEVLDTWFEDTVQPRLRGRAFMVRYADDAVLVFANEEDARRVHAVIGERFAKYGLKLHPDKTRLIEFRPPRNPGQGSGGSFDFLGFTHYWAEALNRKSWVVLRKTMTKRLSRALKSIGEWMRVHRHAPVRHQYAVLCKKLRGHYNYYGIIGNSRALRNFRYWVIVRWHYWLNRRSNSRLTWQRFLRGLKQLQLPEPHVKRTVLPRPANP